MKKIIVVFIFCFITGSVTAQDETVIIDSLLNQTASKKNTRFQKIVIGNRRNGIAYFYPKSTRTVFSIVKRIDYSSSRMHQDSAYEYKYFFLDDKLVKVIHSRTRIKPFRRGYTYLYFKNNELIGHKEFLDYPATNMAYVLSESELLLAKAKELINNK